MSNVPLARIELIRIARRLRVSGQVEAAGTIGEVVSRYLHRRQPVRRMPVHSQSVTRRVRERIVELAESTDMHSAEIAAKVGVNPGRVSEVLQGDR